MDAKQKNRKKKQKFQNKYKEEKVRIGVPV